LEDNSISTELNTDNKTLGAKIRESTLQKIPYMVIIGEKEIQKSVGTEHWPVRTLKNYFVSVRTREGKDLGLVNLYEFALELKAKIENKL
jgi:threonyl-tRNA synthetase